MKYKHLYNIVFFIIFIVFTIGYTFYPIINIKNDNNSNADCYINRVSINTSSGSITNYYNDLNIDNKYKSLLQYLFASCIIISSLIICGILASYLFVPIISKIIFIVVQLFILSYSGILLYLYYSNFIKNTIPNNEDNNITKSYGRGGFLFHIASILMILNRIFLY
jgi:hypothetical protein